MDEREIQKILIEILFSIVNEKECSSAVAEKVTPDILLSVYRLAKKHDLAHIVSKFIYQNNIDVSEDIKLQLQREELMSIYRHEQMNYAYEEICTAFDKANIPYIPLKGAVLRPYYPYESMRMSCDVDILIHESDLKSAITCLKSKGYRCGDRNYHDVSLYSPNKIHLELHFNIYENMDSLDSVLKDAWNYALLVKGCCYNFSIEFFVVHMYSHMAYHFIAGGCGIRSLLDIWVMEHKMNASYSCAEDLLKKAGIYTFAREMSNIANECFSKNKQDEFPDMILKYIYNGGIYGTKQNNIAIQKSKTKSSLLYVFGRIFMPYKSMVILYPALKSFPILLPLFWVIRCISAVLQGNTKRIVSELSCVNNASDGTITEMAEIRARLGI